MFAAEDRNVFPFFGRFPPFSLVKSHFVFFSSSFFNIILFCRTRLCDFLAFKRFRLDFFLCKSNWQREITKKNFEITRNLKLRTFLCSFILPLMACQSNDTMLCLKKKTFYLLIFCWMRIVPHFNNTCLFIELFSKENNIFCVFPSLNNYSETHFHIFRFDPEI